MNIHLPIYLEQRKAPGMGAVYVARPLFFDAPVVRGQELERLQTKLAQDVGKLLAELGRAGRHHELAQYTFAPRLGQQRLDVTLLLRRQTARCRYLFVMFRQFGRRIVFTPSVPELWFDLERGEKLKDRAVEVLTRHFREREHEDEMFDPAATGLTGSASVTALDVPIHPPTLPPKPKLPHFLMLGGAQGAADGAAELARVGRCLDWLYPDDLDRAALRDAELAELTRMLTDRQRRPVLLVGPRQAGKTALIHEFVHRRVAGRASPYRDRGNVWLLAPARLISGMSYVGQWENRLLAILKTAAKRDHVLYFDDLLGLFLAGQSGCSSLSVAAVLKPYLERGDVRVLGEITPEALRVLREHDRGFADLFHLLPLAEPNDADNLRILIGVQRQLESQHRCRFHVEVLPTVLDLQRRYNRAAAFPGKAALFLRQLAVKHRATAPEARVTSRLLRQQPVAEPPPSVTRTEALAEFHVRSGLTMTFLDRQARLERAPMLKALAKQVIGQDGALEAAADALGVAKARLNDPDRPLGSFLFLGPTGVGKTHCAKAVASFLFGDAARLLRFDLNEYNTPGTAARLVGTFSQPEGLLTSALRRQPFAVVLFDEIEKADPEVFDLLLQVLGEGRLTDALGRTADFTNAFIVLTSNLGVSEAEGRIGFRQAEDAAADAVFVRAAERFFRPEFFNRLDRVLPFRRLTRAHVRQIADALIADVFQREGLVQRNCVLQVEALALEHIVDQGFDPVLGARALKRAVERQLTHQLAGRLAVLPAGGFTHAHVYAAPGGLAVEVQPLAQADPVAAPMELVQEPAALLAAVRAAVRRIEDASVQLRPTGAITLGQVSPEMWRYFAVRDQAERVRERERRLHEKVDAARLPERLQPVFSSPDAPRRSRWHKIRWKGKEPLLQEIAAALDINEYLEDLTRMAAQASTGPYEHELAELIHQAALLQTMAGCLREPGPERMLLLLHSGAAPATRLAYRYAPAFRQLQLDVTIHDEDADSMPNPDWLVIQGLHAWPLACNEVGTHLFRPPHAPIELVQVTALPLADGVTPEQAVAAWQAQRQNLLAALAAGLAQAADDPARPGPVLRVHSHKTTLDLRCGFLGTSAAFADYMLAALPPPAEVAAPGR